MMVHVVVLPAAILILLTQLHISAVSPQDHPPDYGPRDDVTESYDDVTDFSQDDGNENIRMLSGESVNHLCHARCRAQCADTHLNEIMDIGGPRNVPLSDPEFRDCMQGCEERYTNADWTKDCEGRVCLLHCNYEQINGSWGEDVDQEDVWIPSSPDITMSEYDATLPRDVTLHWTIKPNAADDENQVYFTIENKFCEDEVWEYLRQTDNMYTKLEADVCSQMEYRVASVNQFGTKGYSEKSFMARTELPAPTEVNDLVQEAVVWNGEVFEMHFSWTTPIGWLSTDIGYYDTPDQEQKSCPPGVIPPPSSVSTNQVPDADGRMTGVMTMSDRGLDCWFQTSITAISRCGVEGSNDILLMDLTDCDAIQNYTCNNEPDVELPPDLVRNLTATQTFDLDNEVILEWLPPVHPPSSDDIDQHEILWGPVEEGDFTISIEEGRKFVGGNVTECYIILNHTDTLYGFAVQAQMDDVKDSAIEVLGVMTMLTLRDEYSPDDSVTEDDVLQSPEQLIAIVVSVVVVIVVLCLLVIFCIRRYYRGKPGKWRELNNKMEYGMILQKQINESLVRNPYYEWSPSSDGSDMTPDHWEVPLSELQFGNVLGSGAFGEVLEATLSAGDLVSNWLEINKLPGMQCPDEGLTVAVKKLLSNQSHVYREDFLMEIAMMKKLGHHPNVVSMIGCCTLVEEPCLIVEMVPHGDLLNYLRKHRTPENEDNSLLTLQDLLSFGRQIAIGMEFLAQKGFVHRDLATRNVLVGNNKVVKIGDFGLTRYIYDDKIYVTRRGGKLPLKWMAIESIFDLTFTVASDVWSFGVVLYELITLGSTPYPIIANKDLLHELQNGYRMEKPNNCPQQLYDIMLSCWRSHPSHRPTFTELKLQLEELVKEQSEFDYLSICVDTGCSSYLPQCSDEDESDVTIGLFEMEQMSRNTAGKNATESDDSSTTTKQTTLSDGVIITLTPNMTRYEVNTERETKWLQLPIHPIGTLPEVTSSRDCDTSNNNVCDETEIADSSAQESRQLNNIDNANDKTIDEERGHNGSLRQIIDMYERGMGRETNTEDNNVVP